MKWYVMTGCADMLAQEGIRQTCREAHDAVVELCMQDRFQGTGFITRCNT